MSAHFSIKKSLLFVLVLTCTLFRIEAVLADPGCQDAQVFSGKLITDICWTCLFPLRIAGATMSAGDGRMPAKAHKEPLCVCFDTNGVPEPGLTTSMWEPAWLVEFERVPGCLSALGGTRLPFDRTFQGNHSNGDHDSTDGSFMHYHYYAFPLLSILDLYTDGTCNPDGYLDFDLMFVSEVDPTWNNDELAFFTNPEAAVVANPVATLACIPDAISSTVGKPIDQLFWCAGSWGGIYPLSGSINGGAGVIKDSSILKARVLAAQHRRGIMRGTVGREALCRAPIKVTLPKDQYKFSLFYPIAETQKAHVMGESILKWGNAKTIPGIGQDPVYTIWRWKDCCVR